MMHDDIVDEPEVLKIDSNIMDGSDFESTIMLINKIWEDNDLLFVELSATEADYGNNDEDCENSLDADSGVDGSDGDDGYNVDRQTDSDLVHLLADVPASKAGQARLPLVLHMLLPKVGN